MTPSCPLPRLESNPISPSHLLYAASPLLSLSPASLLPLLPRRFLLIHGGRDPLVPFSQSTLLRTLLVGLGIDEVRLRLCRDEGALGALASELRPFFNPSSLPSFLDLDRSLSLYSCARAKKN